MSREKNALKIIVRAIHLVELAMHVLEWRITAPNNKIKCISENKFPFVGRDLFTRHTDIEYPDTEIIDNSLFFFPKERLTWTGSKIDLVELIYAWEKAGCFNHGHANIKEIAAYLEVVFNIDLGDYYDIFRDMRNRVSRTAFLDKLIKFLNDRMDEVDRRN